MKNKTIILITIFLLAAASISAQTADSAFGGDNSGPPAAKTSSSGYYKNEFYGGYSYESIRDRPPYNGLEIAYTRNISRYFGIKSDFGYGHVNATEKCCANTVLDQSAYSFTGGIQIKDNAASKRFKPFAHAMAGISHAVGGEYCGGVACDVGTNTSFVMILGGGIDIKATRRFDIRVIQIDYKPSHIVGLWFNTYRIGSGIVFHF